MLWSAIPLPPVSDPWPLSMEFLGPRTQPFRSSLLVRPVAPTSGSFWFQDRWRVARQLHPSELTLIMLVAWLLVDRPQTHQMGPLVLIAPALRTIVGPFAPRPPSGLPPPTRASVEAPTAPSGSRSSGRTARTPSMTGVVTWLRTRSCKASRFSFGVQTFMCAGNGVGWSTKSWLCLRRSVSHLIVARIATISPP